jgi:hypothetical protein
VNGAEDSIKETTRSGFPLQGSVPHEDSPMAKATSSQPNPTRHLARIVFLTLLLTFIASRVLVILIMTRHMPDLFLHAGGTHIHHLNYGIFLLSTTGAVLLFADLTERGRQWAAVAYGLGMGMTFDEFGMWLHLGGGYWQRASFDAIIVLLAIAGLLAFAPRWNRVGPKHYTIAGLTLAAVAVFAWLSLKSLNFVEKRVGNRLEEIEENGPQ